MVYEIVSNYKTLVQSLGELIQVSGYRSDYIAKKIGMKPANFSQKKQKGNWSVDEVERLMEVIENEDTENYLLLQLMRAAKKDETVSYEEFKKEMGWK
ncbi:MAG TPA: hypothetical protein VL832_06370 [Puia sp.]|jgi:hypothetical protein|nr:hypothetical protein [Puia sp.]